VFTEQRGIAEFAGLEIDGLEIAGLLAILSVNFHSCKFQLPNSGTVWYDVLVGREAEAV